MKVSVNKTLIMRNFPDIENGYRSDSIFISLMGP